MTTTTLNLQGKSLRKAEDILATIYTSTSEALEANPTWVEGFCSIYIPIHETLTIKAKVWIGVPTNEVRYFITTSHAPKAKVAPMSYSQALNTIRYYQAQ